MNKRLIWMCVLGFHAVVLGLALMTYAESGVTWFAGLFLATLPFSLWLERRGRRNPRRIPS
jgi:hypothetical protein